MTYAERIQEVVVLGASGKMGRGIVLLLALEMAGFPSARGFPKRRLYAVGRSKEGLKGLMDYLRAEIRHIGETKTAGGNSLSVDRYVADVLSIVRPATTLISSARPTLVIESLPEDVSLKSRRLRALASRPRGGIPWILTNTSAIPIHELDARARLGGRIIGFHFYNPPPTQKLVEVAIAESTFPELVKFADTLAAALDKTVVRPKDRAGFIGNGYLMRDLLYGLSEVGHLQRTMPFIHAVYCVDRTTRDFMLRPMGIFQLVDFVGLDVCLSVLREMDERLPTRIFQSPVLSEMVDAGIIGGINPDGSRRNGFMSYSKNRPDGIYDPGARNYAPLAAFRAACDSFLGPKPIPALTWKSAMRSEHRVAVLRRYFTRLHASPSLGARLAKRYLAKEQQIADGLLKDGTAASREDLDLVLRMGFHRAYGIDDFQDFAYSQTTPN